MILAVIPARGGSKRLPGKNVALFGGRPLLWWSVAVARALKNVQCVVSTENAEIAAVAKQAGADVIDRPDDLAGDDSPMSQVLIHAAQYVRRQNVAFEGVMLLQPTNPLRPVAMVERAIARFLSEPCDSLIAVSGRPLKTGTVECGRFIRNYGPDTQSRGTPPTYYENGLLYLTKATTLLDQASIYGERVLAFETERPFDEVDIDEPVDLVIGEAILNAVYDQLSYA
jgi:CMP-N-acetylneuraminic acid synthetase